MPVGIGLLGFWLLVVVGPDCAEGELLRSCEQTVPAEQDWHGYEHTTIPNFLAIYLVHAINREPLQEVTGPGKSWSSEHS